MSDSARKPKQAQRLTQTWQARLLRGVLGASTVFLTLAATGCASASLGGGSSGGGEPTPDAPVVSNQPGAWFDAQGDLTIVGPGHRLRLVLSAPLSACTMLDQTASGEAPKTMGLPFSVVAEACREQHSTILLAEESETASPAELEHSYHDVAHCAASELGLRSGWVPASLEQSDPCPQFIGLGWRLPSHAELQGLTVDDRKAVAGALFDTGVSSNYGALVLFTQDAGKIGLATLSPNAAEVAPELTPEKRAQPYSGAALRCVRDVTKSASARHAAQPVVPHARQCMLAQAQEQGLTSTQPPPPPPSPEVERLRAWVEIARRAPRMLQNPEQLDELGKLLAAPELEHMVDEAATERALTERYSELAESLDDPQASPKELARRRQEFEQLRKKLGGEIVHSATKKGRDEHLPALLSSVVEMLEDARTLSIKKRSKAKLSYDPLLKRAKELLENKVPKP